jgi:HPt (histidine-containing phosphotransfer) domain-containing protein
MDGSKQTAGAVAIAAELNTLAIEEPVPMLDRDAALRSVGGDLDLLREVAALFLKECPTAMAKLRDAVAQRDAASIQRQAHSLKGSIALFGTDVVLQAAYRLQLQGSNGDLRHVQANLVDLERLLLQLCEDIQKLISE